MRCLHDSEDGRFKKEARYVVSRISRGNYYNRATIFIVNGGEENGWIETYIDRLTPFERSLRAYIDGELNAP